MKNQTNTLNVCLNLWYSRQSNTSVTTRSKQIISWLKGCSCRAWLCKMKLNFWKKNFHFAPTFLIKTNRSNDSVETKDPVTLYQRTEYQPQTQWNKPLHDRQMERKNITPQLSLWGLHIFPPQYLIHLQNQAKRLSTWTVPGTNKGNYGIREFSLFLSEKVLSIITWPSTGNTALWTDRHNVHNNTSPNPTKSVIDLIYL